MEQLSKSEKNEPCFAENQLLLICANCKREANSEADKSTFKLCSGCHKVHYCNRDCQLTDWRNHKASCKAARTSILNATQSTVRDDFNSLLFYCRKGDLEGIQREIARGVNMNAVTSNRVLQTWGGLIIGRCKECAELLLQHNLNPNVQDKDGFTPLFAACQANCEEFVELLLQHKANPNIRTKGGTPLLLACAEGHDKCVSLLLKNKADSNIASDLNGSTPLLIACQYGRDNCASLLLHHDADPNIANMDGCSPLHMACQEGHDKCVSLLLQYNVDPNIATTNAGEFSP